MEYWQYEILAKSHGICDQRWDFTIFFAKSVGTLIKQNNMLYTI